MMGDDAINPMHAVGLMAATTAAVFWAGAVVLYRRVGTVMPPVRLNLVKGLVASCIIGVYVLVDAVVLGHTQWELPVRLLALMAVSGMIGIGLGDSLFFAGLNRLGARRMLLLFTVNPVITVLVAWALLGEPLGVWQIFGIALTVGGIAWVIAERTPGPDVADDGHVDGLGIAFGLGAATCQAAGLLISRWVFSQGEITAMSSAWLRITAGALILCMFLPLDRHLRDAGGQAHHHPNAPYPLEAAMMFTAAMLLGTVLGISLMQVAVKESGQVGVASTLLSTSPLFVLPIVALMGERISPRAIGGAVVTVAGVGLLYMVSA